MQSKKIKILDFNNIDNKFNLKMINFFSVFVATVLFTELFLVIALLKPLKEPYFVRDFWHWLQEHKMLHPLKIIPFLLILLIINTFLEISWENNFYANLLNEVTDSTLILDFYLSIVSISWTCLIMALYLILLIERLTQFLITIARLLEFELMCRHAILTKDDGTQVSIHGSNSY